MDAKIKGLVVMYCAYYITSGLIFNKITFELFRRDPHIFHNAQLQLWKFFITNIKYVKSLFLLLYWYMIWWLYYRPCSAVDSFSNPKVLAVIVKLQRAEIRLRLYSEFSLSTPLRSKGLNPSIETIEIETSYHDLRIKYNYVR
jgi:hypothetical protein